MSLNQGRIRRVALFRKGHCELPGKAARRLHSEQMVCPRSGNPEAAACILPGRQAEKASEGIWNAEQQDGDRVSRSGAGIAGQPLCPGQPPMRPCWTGQGRSLGRWAGSAARFHLDLHSLAAYHLQAGSALGPPTPVAPEQRSRGDGQRVQEYAHPAWMFGRLSVPLTGLAQVAGATITDASLIHDAQAPIRFSTLFGGREPCSGGTTQRAIGLPGKVVPREATLFPGLAGRCWSIALRGN